jgi:zinc protease
LAQICADLREHEINEDEFERARKPRVETLVKLQQTNEYWQAALVRAQTDPKALRIIRTLLPDLQQATTADVRTVANLYLQDDRLWRLHITPDSTNPRGSADEQ